METRHSLSWRAGRWTRPPGDEPGEIEVIWARTGERVWPRQDGASSDTRTLRERLDIPRDADLVLDPAAGWTGQRPAPDVAQDRPAWHAGEPTGSDVARSGTPIAADTTGTTARVTDSGREGARSDDTAESQFLPVGADRHEDGTDEDRFDAADPRLAPPAEAMTAVARGDAEVVADEIISSVDHRCYLLTDVHDPELAIRGAHDLASELVRRQITVAHLHVGPSIEDEVTLADGGPAIDDVGRQVGTDDGQEYLAVTTGAVEKASLVEALEQLRDKVDRVIVTGTGSGIDARQTRLAALTDAVITRDDSGVTNDGFARAFADHSLPVDAVLVGGTVEEPTSGGAGPEMRWALLALLLAVLVGVGSWLIYRAVADDGESTTTTPPGSIEGSVASTTPPPATATTPPSTIPPPTTEPPATAGGGPDLGDPRLLAAPTITIDGDLTITGAVRSEATAARVLAAASALAGDSPIDDGLLVDPAAVPWNQTRIVLAVDALDDGAIVDRWVGAVQALAQPPDAAVVIRSEERARGRQLRRVLVDAGVDRGIVRLTAERAGSGMVVVVVEAEDA